MREKKAKKPSRSVGHLLFADRSLQRISLRKLSARVKKAKQTPRSSRVKHAASANTAMRFPWPISSRALVLGVITVVAGAALITAGQPSHRAEVANVNAPPAATARLEQGPRPAPLGRKETGVSRASAATVAAKAAAAEPAPTVAAVESPAKPDVQNAAPVTITGCLELDKETFWLKDTSGVEAPTSRSWRSGFLKKRPASIEVLDPTNRLKLPNYVGQRVAATGILTNEEIRAQSLRRIAVSCK